MEKAEEMATNLTERSFSHSLITIGNVSPNHISLAHATCDMSDTNLIAYSAIDQYSFDKFYGIMIDTGASKHFTAGYGQFMTYTRDIKDTTIDIAKAGAIHVQLGIGSISSMGSVLIQTTIGHIKFHIVKADTPFFLCLADMDQLGVYFNNIDNSLVMKSTSILVIRRFDHPFLLWESSLNSFIIQSFDRNPCYLTETELRQLYRRFGHPSAMKLHLLFERSRHEVNKLTLDRLTKYCSLCQKHGKSPGRFKFTLWDDVNYNYSIFVDIIYIDNSPIIHVVDKVMRY